MYCGMCAGWVAGVLFIVVVHHVSCMLGRYQGTCLLWLYITFHVCWVGIRGPVYCGCTSRFMCAGWVAGVLFIVVVRNVSCVLGR